MAGHRRIISALAACALGEGQPREDVGTVWKVVRRYGLSPREEDVLVMLLRGVHMKEVAASLGCSYSTVRTHAQRAAKKLDCSGTPQLLARIVRDSFPAAGSPHA